MQSTYFIHVSITVLAAIGLMCIHTQTHTHTVSPSLPFDSAIFLVSIHPPLELKKILVNK